MNALREYCKILYGSLTASHWRDPHIAWVRIGYLWEEFMIMIKEAWK